MRICRGFYLLLLVTLPSMVVLATVWLLLEAPSRPFAAETPFYLAASGNDHNNCPAALSPCVATRAVHSSQNISLNELYPPKWRRIKNDFALQVVIVPTALNLRSDASGTDSYTCLDRQIGQMSRTMIMDIFTIGETRWMGASRNTI